MGLMCKQVWPLCFELDYSIILTSVAAGQVRSGQGVFQKTQTWPGQSLRKFGDPRPDLLGQIGSGQIGSGQSLVGSDPGWPNIYM